MEMEANHLMNQMRIIIIFVLLFIYPSLFCATHKNVDSLSIHRNAVYQIGAKLNSLEKEIKEKTKLHITSVDQIKDLETELKQQRDLVTASIQKLKKAEEDNFKILQNYLVESDEEETEQWQRKIHVELLKQSTEKYTKELQTLNSLKQQMVEFENQLTTLKISENELATLIQELEMRKKVTMENYLNKVEEKKKIEKIVQRKTITSAIKKVQHKFSQAPINLKKPSRIFNHPLKEFKALTSSAKGVTFKFNSIQPVKAVDSGKIVFAGELSTYGQVIMIDHGDELRTVLLGKLDLKVKKNDVVTKGDLLATTIREGNEPSTLYFEVRKKNIAQNTILWLDSNGVSKI
jgi:murein DD-endopeptidase MepM/ murein hydrolase activator NlpD